MGNPKSDTGSAQPDTGSAQPDTGSAQSDVGLGTPDVGLGTPDVGLGTPDVGLGTPDVGRIGIDIELADSEVGFAAADIGSSVDDVGLDKFHTGFGSDEWVSGKEPQRRRDSDIGMAMRHQVGRAVLSAPQRWRVSRARPGAVRTPRPTILRPPSREVGWKPQRRRDAEREMPLRGREAG